MAGIDAWIEFWGRQTPAAPAAVGTAGPVAWGELAVRVRARAAGIEPGTAVAPDIDADPVELLLACAAAGAVLDLTGAGHAARPASGMHRTLLRLPADLTPGDTVELTHHDVEALAVAGIAADGLRPADRVAVTGSPVARLLAALPVLHAGAAVGPPGGHDVTVLHGLAPDPVAGTALRRIVVTEPAPPDLVAGWAAHGVDVVLAYGPAEASGFSLREPRPGAPLVALPGRRARVLDGELLLAGAGVVAAGADGWLHTGRRAVEGPSGIRLTDLVTSS